MPGVAQAGTSPEPVLDATVVAESVANLPRPRGPRDDRAAANGARHPRPGRPADRMQGQLDLAAAFEEPVEANRVAGMCERCGARVEVGACALPTRRWRWSTAEKAGTRTGRPSASAIGP